MKQVDVGRLELGLVPGTERVIYLHDIGGVTDARAVRMEVAHERGAWVLVQAGHEGSEWRHGGVYALPGFALDLLHVVTSLGMGDVLLVASGASRYVATCVAQVAPDLVAGIDVLSDEGGWSADPADGAGGRDWISGVNRLPVVGEGLCQGDDPVLSLGPPEPVSDAAVEAWTGNLSVTWWASGDTPAGFPPGLRVSTPHWEGTPDLLGSC